MTGNLSKRMYRGAASEMQSRHDLSESDYRVFPPSKWVKLIQMRSWWAMSQAWEA